MSYRSAARHEAQGFFPLGGENRNRFGPTADEPQPWAVQFLASALDDLAAETATGKALTFDAKWLLAWLVIGVDHAKPKETMRCSATGLAEWLRAPRPDEDQLDDQRARRMGGSLRRRLGAALEELDAAELIEWAPGRPGHDGFLKVSCYELLAAEGKPELGDFVPIYRTRIEEWSLKLGLDFDGRVLLLRALINTDPESLLVADSERELCDKLDIGHDRAARLLTLDGKLRRDPLPVRGQKLRAPRHDPRGILQRTNAGAIEMSVYWELVKPMGRHHRVSNARATRAFADVPHEAPRLKRASDQGFRGLDLGVDFADRVSNARAARLKRASGASQTRERPGLLSGDLLPKFTYPPHPPTATTTEAVTDDGEGRKDREIANQGRAVDSVIVRWQQQWPERHAAIRTARVRHAVIEVLTKGVSSVDLADGVVDLDRVFGDLRTAKAVVPCLVKRIESIANEAEAKLEENKRRAPMAEKRAAAIEEDGRRAEEDRRRSEERSSRRARHRWAVSVALSDAGMDAVVQQQQIQIRRLGRPTRALRLIEDDLISWACLASRKRPDLPLADALNEELADNMRFELVGAVADEFEFPVPLASTPAVDLSERVAASLKRLSRQVVSVATEV